MITLIVVALVFATLWYMRMLDKQRDTDRIRARRAHVAACTTKHPNAVLHPGGYCPDGVLHEYVDEGDVGCPSIVCQVCDHDFGDEYRPKKGS